MLSLEEAEYLFSFNLEKGYYHIDLNNSVKDLFSFAFKVNGKTYYGRYTIGPFGLASMPFLFTSVLKLLVCRWREAGLHYYIFLDDGIGATKTKEEGQYFSGMVHSDLAKAGWKQQAGKSQWDPVKELPWLGFDII